MQYILYRKQYVPYEHSSTYKITTIYITIFLEILVAAVIIIFPLMHNPRIIKFYKKIDPN